MTYHPLTGHERCECGHLAFSHKKFWGECMACASPHMFTDARTGVSFAERKSRRLTK